MSDWLVYIIQCADNTLYTGMTNNLPQRIQQHENGRGARYTKGRGPLTVKYVEFCANKSHALKREYQIKQLNRQEKLKLLTKGCVN